MCPPFLKIGPCAQCDYCKKHILQDNPSRSVMSMRQQYPPACQSQNRLKLVREVLIVEAFLPAFLYPSK